MQINFDAVITDALGREVFEPELTPTGRQVLVEAKDDDGHPIMVPGPDGRPIPQREPKMNPVTLRQVCVTALTRKWPDEQLTEALTVERFALALKIAAGGDIDLSLEERGKVQAATDNWRSVAPVYMARARMLLDPKSGTNA